MKPIYNDLSGALLDVIAVQDPITVKALRESVANQINSQRSAQKPPMECVNLTEQVADIIIGSTVQGAGTLEVHLIDPLWELLKRYADGKDGTTAFFDTDQKGYLWPPIDLNFPPDSTGAMWRLCQLRASTDISAPNLILTFEDRVASDLREFEGPVVSNPNETRAEFIKRLVKEAQLGDHTASQGVAAAVAQASSGGSVGTGKPITGTPDGKIRFIALLPAKDFTSADLTSDQRTPTQSQKTKNRNANKAPATTVGKAIALAVNPVQIAVTQLAGDVVGTLDGGGGGGFVFSTPITATP